MNCAKATELISALVDAELSPDQEKELKAHLETCPRCRQEYVELERLEEMMSKIALPELSEDVWEEHWESLYNRLERGIGYLLAGLGAAVVLSYGLYSLLKDWLSDPSVPIAFRAGVSLLCAGLLILVISTAREKILTCRHERYKEIVR